MQSERETDVSRPRHHPCVVDEEQPHHDDSLPEHEQTRPQTLSREGRPLAPPHSRGQQSDTAVRPGWCQFSAVAHIPAALPRAACQVLSNAHWQE